MKIAVVFNAQKNNDSDSVRLIIDTLLSFKADVFMLGSDSEDFGNLKVTVCDTPENLMKTCDIVLAIGGDGTIMHAAKLAAGFGKPVLGINSGRLGFMASIEKDQVGKLSELFTGNYKISERMMLEVKHDEQKFFALNDVVISRSFDSQIVDYKIRRSSESLCGYRADGIIIATPTGSTAYSLSAGGPIVESDISCIIVTPICAHSLYARSMILSPDKPIIAEYSLKSDSKVLVAVDGQMCFSDFSDSELVVKKSSLFAKFIVLGHNNFYKNIDKKLINKTYL